MEGRAGSRGYILAFHSQNVEGAHYKVHDDHVGLDATLGELAECSVPVLRLLDVVLTLRDAPHRLPARYACITFDDGTDYDWEAIRGPSGQVHESFGSILRRYGASGTAFVIASPEAREDIMRRLSPVRMSEAWWREAQQSGVVDIGVHGWDHVHPSVASVASTPDLAGRFDRVATPAQARKQVDDAVEYIALRAGPGSARLFAYPYGQVSEYLASDYLERQDRIFAAFTTDGIALTPGMDRWRLPRFVHGWHWHGRPALRSLLEA